MSVIPPLPPELRIAIVAAACVGAALLAWARERRGRQAASRWRRRRTPGGLRRALRAALIVAGIGLAASTLLADPAESASDDARDLPETLVVALDISRSMEATDVAPSRLEAARAFVTAVTARTAPAAIGLVLFAGEPALVCPLTSDAGALQMALTEVPAAQTATAGGSAIGAALTRAAAAFGARPQRRTILLLSDGEETAGDAGAAVASLRASGITVHAVGIGTPRGVEMPLRRPRPGEAPEGATRVTRLEPGPLRAVTTGTGGLYVEGVGERALAQIVGRLQAPHEGARGIGGWLSAWLLCAAGLCLLAERWVAVAPAGGRPR